MTDKELADAVHMAAKELGKAVRKAEDAGLEVSIEVGEIDVTYYDSLYVSHPTAITEVVASVKRVTTVNY